MKVAALVEQRPKRCLREEVLEIDEVKHASDSNKKISIPFAKDTGLVFL